MASETLHLSFDLANGENIGIAASAECAALMEMMKKAHSMRSVPGERLAARVEMIPQEPVSDILIDSRFLQASYPANDVPRIFIKTIPDDQIMLAAVAKRLMFLTLLPYLEKQQIYLMHGGLVVDTNGDGVIFCGPSGVGKSTAVAKAGTVWEILADDLMFLSFRDGKCFAQPGPTWSTWFSEKQRLAECDVNRIVPVRNTVVLSRIDAPGIHPLEPGRAGLMLANSFMDMMTWHSRNILSPEVQSNLRRKAFDGVIQMTQSCRCYRLTSELATDIVPMLRSITD